MKDGFCQIFMETCCGCSLELPQHAHKNHLSKAILMSTHIIEDIYVKLSLNYHQILLDHHLGCFCLPYYLSITHGYCLTGMVYNKDLEPLTQLVEGLFTIIGGTSLYIL